MSNTIQHYYFNDTSKYGESLKLGTDISKLNEKQTGDRKGSFAVIARDDAATIEISELAKIMYATASDVSNAEREQKELEDYIASHPADTSIDVLRNGSLLKQANEGAIRVVDEAMIAAEKEYTNAFSDAAKGFSDFSMKITYGDYNSNDISVKDMKFDAIDKMEDVYNSYKEQIQLNYEGDEKEKYLSKLDDVYNTVFAEKIIEPVKNAYDDKLTFFKPDSEESVKSIKAASYSKESLQEMISGYMTNQSLNRRQYAALSDGTKAFYDMAENTSLWHDTNAIKSILTDTMNAYSSVKEIKSESSEYLFAKAAADGIARTFSDKYAESMEYKAEKLGFKKNGKDTEWSQIANNVVNDYIDDTSSGIFTIDFSRIKDWSSIMENI